jgi:hypothetical protein
VSAAGLLWVLDKSQAVGRLYFFLALWIIILLLGPTFYYSGIFGATISWLCAYCKTTILISECQIAQHDLLISFLITGFWGSAFTLVACLYRSGYLGKAVAYLGLLALAIAPMAFSGMDLKEIAAEGGYYEKPAVLDVFLQKWTAEHKESNGEQFRITHLVDEPLSMPADYWKTTNEPYFLARAHFGRDVLLADTHFSTHWNYSNGYALAETAQIAYLVNGAVVKSNLHAKELPAGVASDYPLARFCGLTNSKYVITEKRNSEGITPLLDPLLFSLVHVDDFLNLRIYQVKHCGSRCYF